MIAGIFRSGFAVILSSAQCIADAGSLQEYLRGGQVETEMRQFQESIRPTEGIPAGVQSNWDL